MKGSRTIQTYPAAHGFFDSILPHELGHIVFREQIGLAPDVPLWFEEGVAMYQEKAKRWGADTDVQNAITNNRFIPLPELSRVRLSQATDQETVFLFYAEAASAVHFFISQLGEFKFSLFCQNLKKGMPFDQALKESYYYFHDLPAFNKAWLGYLDK